MKMQVVKSKIRRTLNKVKKSPNRKMSKKSNPLSSLTKGANFDGKIFGQKIPIFSGLLKNKVVQSVIIGTGTVATIGALVQLVDNDKVNSLWNRKEVRAGTALASGDLVSAGSVLLLENPNILQKFRGRNTQASSEQGLSNQAGFA